MLRSYTNLKLLKFKDDSNFIYSKCDIYQGLQTDLADLHNGVVDNNIIDIMEDSLYDSGVQPVAMIKGNSFNALRDRAQASPPHLFRVEYHKTRTLVDARSNHIMMDMYYDADTRMIRNR